VEEHTSVHIMLNAPELRALLESLLPLVISKAAIGDASHNQGNVWHGMSAIISDSSRSHWPPMF